MSTQSGKERQREMTAFCRAEHPRLVGALMLQTGDRGVAEDLAQEVLIKVCQHWEKVSAMASPRGWLHTVAANQARSWVTAPWSAAPVCAMAPGRWRGGDGTEGADRVAVRAAVRALPLRQRTALVLRYYADLPAAQVAVSMGCSEGTVRALTYQAIATLRRSGGLLEEVCDAC